MRIPLGDGLSGLDVCTVLDIDDRTVRHLVTFALASMGIHDRQLAGTGYRHQVAVAMLHGLEVVEFDCAGGLDVHVVDCRRTRSRTTDVEGTHCQLGTRLANRLRSDDAHCLANVDDVATCEVASVTQRADAECRFAGDRRAHQNGLHAFDFKLLDDLLVKQGSARDDRIFLVAGRKHVFGHDAAEHAITQWLDDIAAFDDG